MAETPLPSPSYSDEARIKNAEAIIEKIDNEDERREKHAAKIVKGNVKVKKKPAAKKVGDAILGEDLKEVKTYLLWDVLIPAVKDTIADIVKKGIDAMLFGGTGAPRNVKRERGYSRASYSNYYDRDRREREKSRGRRANRRAMHDFDDIVFSDRFDAENVLDCLVETTLDYGMVSVADFYELAGAEVSWADNKYGWGDLGDACVTRVRDGYVLDLPRPEPID